MFYKCFWTNLEWFSFQVFWIIREVLIEYWASGQNIWLWDENVVTYQDYQDAWNCALSFICLCIIHGTYHNTSNILMMIFTEHLNINQPCSKYFTCICPFNYCNLSMRQILFLSSGYRWGCWGSERLNNQSKVTLVQPWKWFFTTYPVLFFKKEMVGGFEAF